MAREPANYQRPGLTSKSWTSKHAGCIVNGTCSHHACSDLLTNISKYPEQIYLYLSERPGMRLHWCKNQLLGEQECGVYTKSSLMLGLGEEDDEVIDAMLDLRDAGA